jgi:hypothetical protein
MKELGLEKHKFYKLNGLVFSITFFVSRILPIVPLWIHFFYLASTPQWKTIGSWTVAFLCFVGVALDSLNVFWFRKIISQAIELHKKTA